MPQAATPALKHILAADIGGTNSRFGHFTMAGDGSLALCRLVSLPTQAAGSFAALLAGLPEAGFDLPLGDAAAAAFAVPGAVLGRTVHFANIDWALDLEELERVYGLGNSICINDFLAQAYGCRLLGGDAQTVLPGEMDAGKVQAVIGAGTGLGHAALIPLADGACMALPSERGQSSASFFGPEETAFAAFLRQATGEDYVRYDSVLSGFGLERLHHFLTGEELPAALIGPGLTAASPTAALFARFYGRAARDYALTMLAEGGVFLSGGLAAKNPVLVKHPEFAREFLASPTYGHLLARIPVRLVRDDSVGLFGAAAVARTLLAP